MSAVRRGGIVSILGVYPVNYDNFRLGQIFDKGITIKAGQCNVHAIIDRLLDYVRKEQVVLDDIITHRLSIEDVSVGYDIFDKKIENCVKVVLDPWKSSVLKSK